MGKRRPTFYQCIMRRARSATKARVDPRHRDSAAGVRLRQLQGERGAHEPSRLAERPQSEKVAAENSLPGAAVRPSRCVRRHSHAMVQGSHQTGSSDLEQPPKHGGNYETHRFKLAGPRACSPFRLPKPALSFALVAFIMLDAPAQSACIGPSPPPRSWAVLWRARLSYGQPMACTAASSIDGFTRRRSRLPLKVCQAFQRFMAGVRRRCHATG